MDSISPSSSSLTIESITSVYVSFILFSFSIHINFVHVGFGSCTRYFGLQLLRIDYSWIINKAFLSDHKRHVYTYRISFCWYLQTLSYVQVNLVKKIRTSTVSLSLPLCVSICACRCVVMLCRHNNNLQLTKRVSSTSETFVFRSPWWSKQEKEIFVRFYLFGWFFY